MNGWPYFRAYSVRNTVADPSAMTAPMTAPNKNLTAAPLTRHDEQPGFPALGSLALVRYGYFDSRESRLG